MIFSGETVEWCGFHVLSLNLPAPYAGVYLFAQVETDKPYIGNAHNVEIRAGKEHGRGHSPMKFRNGIKKHGKHKFAVFPILYMVRYDEEKNSFVNSFKMTKDDWDWLCNIEAQHIFEYDAVRRGYNVQEASSGVGPYGTEYCKILSEARSQPAAVARWRATMNQPEVKDRYRASMIAAMAKPETKDRHCAATAEAMAKPETRERWIAALKVAMNDPEVLARRHATMSDPEVKARFCAAVIAGQANPDARKKMSVGVLAALQRPEVIANRKAGVIKRKETMANKKRDAR